MSPSPTFVSCLLLAMLIAMASAATAIEKTGTGTKDSKVSAKMEARIREDALTANADSQGADEGRRLLAIRAQVASSGPVREEVADRTVEWTNTSPNKAKPLTQQAVQSVDGAGNRKLHASQNDVVKEEVADNDVAQISASVDKVKPPTEHAVQNVDFKLPWGK